MIVSVRLAVLGGCGHDGLMVLDAVEGPAFPDHQRGVCDSEPYLYSLEAQCRWLWGGDGPAPHCAAL